jgi:carboxyl-terminal processing protease
LEFDHIDPADYASLGKNSPNLISQVNQLSKKRVAKDPEFQKLNEDIQKYLSRKNRKEISLNEAVRLKEKQQDEKNQKKKGEEEKPEVENPPIFPEGFYNDEVLGISLDYFELLKAQNTAQK